VARELTKLHEELARGTLSALAARFGGEVRGEITIVVSGVASGVASDTSAVPGEGEAAAVPAEPLEAELRRRLVAGEPPSALAREVARARGLRRADVYDAIERLKKESR
jgi:16S rRNA (cytidine1402-2'-O)-methyltransferase